MLNDRTKIVVGSDDVVSVPEAAKILGVHHTTIYRWFQKGKVRPFRLGKQVYLTIDDVELLKKERTSE